MGCNVVYLPPVHPIGTTFRKGRNNSLQAGPGDPGSPWAIGSSDGGHDAIHPDLGTFADFTAFVSRARELGMEVAIDLALQASPDHPWAKEHPEWFTVRADGTIAYAENPPKKYQDIYPLNLDNDFEGLYQEINRIVRLWMDHGVRIFRVDNPHTKPVKFWDRLLADIRSTDPDVLFLAEAFTRPAMMGTLGKVGFHQSYTYFTWRNGKDELTEYLQQLSGPAAAYLRPNFFANTPDILHEYLVYGGQAPVKIRALLPPLLQAARQAGEPGGAVSDVVSDRGANGASDTVLAVVNLDPHQPREATVWLDMPELGMDWHEGFTVTDELTGESFRWGQANYVRLDPTVRVAHIFTVTRDLA